ncbi:MFS family permease [Arthrobacter sp. V1I9]|nr:MFS family permease [Arthrobacter sp. V1I9]
MTSTISTQRTERAAMRKTLVGTGIGNAVEWYDWAIYATFTPFIASQLFSKADPASAVLSTLAIFAVGFVARPFGGFLFGWIGDRVGRKTSMTLAVGLASLGSLMIGIAPTFASIGAWASLMLLVARLVQGLAHGGELPSSQTYLSEMAPKEKRGFWATLIYTSGTVGILFGTLLGAVLNMVLSTEAMNAWGWRIPFLIGAALGLYALIMRSRLHETEAFESESAGEKRAPIWPQIVRHRRQALQVIGLTVGLTVIYYIWGVVAPSYATTALKIDRGEALWAGVIGNIVVHRGAALLGQTVGPHRPQESALVRRHRVRRHALPHDLAAQGFRVAAGCRHVRDADLHCRERRHCSGRVCRTFPHQHPHGGRGRPVLHLRGAVRRHRAVPAAVAGHYPPTAGPVQRLRRAAARGQCPVRVHHPGNEGQGPDALVFPRK